MSTSENKEKVYNIEDLLERPVTDKDLKLEDLSKSAIDKLEIFIKIYDRDIIEVQNKNEHLLEEIKKNNNEIIALVSQKALIMKFLGR